MDKAAKGSPGEPIDHIQERLASYAFSLSYESLGADAVHATKVRVIDTLGALLAGYSGEPCHIARKLAAQVRAVHGVSVIGSRMTTTPEMAAFVNATTARYIELNDIYNGPGRPGGHPSDVVLPTLAAAEHIHANGRDFITGVALAYEVYLRLTDAVETPGFDYTNFVCLGTAVAAGKLMGLDRDQLAHCISMTVVPNNALLQGRVGHLSMWKVMATGQAGRAGVFAALLAREGVKGPHLPFVGKAGWCTYVSRKPFTLDVWGGNGVPFKVDETFIKQRPARYITIPAIFAAERVAPIHHVRDVKEVTVESFQRAVDGTHPHHWDPRSRETADHSIPYVVAATLMDGTITSRSYDDAHLNDPELRALMKKIKIVADADFTKAHEQSSQHYTRVTVLAADRVLVGESGGPNGDLSDVLSDAQIEEKFRALTEEALGAERVRFILDRLWDLERMDDVVEIASALVI